MNKIFALDAATGSQFWTFDPEVSTDAVGFNASCRGLVYFENPQAEQGELCATRVINLTHDARMTHFTDRTVEIVDGQICRVTNYYNLDDWLRQVRG